MKTKITLLLTLFHLCMTSNLFSQKTEANNNDFKIGNVAWGKYCQTFDEQLEAIDTSRITIINGQEVPSSIYDVLSNDGFNIIRTYEPSTQRYIENDREWGHNKEDYKNMLQLIGNHDMQVMTYIDLWLKCYQNSTKGGSPILAFENEYNLDTMDTYYLNFDDQFTEIYDEDPYKSIVWGHNLTGENTYHDYLDLGARPMVGCWRGAGDTSWPNGCYELWNHGITNTPPILIDNAFEHFGNLNSSGQYLINIPGAHNNNIEFPANGAADDKYSKYFVPGDNSVIEHPADIIIDAGYMPANFYLYLSDGEDNRDRYRYLWNFENIDYEKRYFSNVHAEIAVNTLPRDADHSSRRRRSSSLSNDNFNNVWFKAFTSIIHGVNGIWFYNVMGMYKEEQLDIERKNNWQNVKNPLRFYLINFPIDYQLKLRYLIRQLRGLKNLNLISTDPNSIVYTKTGHYDENEIVPSCNQYLPPYISDTPQFRDMKELMLLYYKQPHDLTYWDDLLNDNNNVNSDNEKFGLRYTVRTNGEEVIMIISNPNPFWLENVPLSFEGVANPVLRNSDQVRILFEGIGDNFNFKSENYKYDRSSSIDLSATSLDNLVSLTKEVGFVENQLIISFGSFDVHVLQFIQDSEAISGYKNGWERVWSNWGSGFINDKEIMDYDKFLAGDFDGDGDEELFCIQLVDHPYNWVNIYKFTNQGWKYFWNNSKSDLIGDWTIQENDRLFVGDFLDDAEGKDELLIIQSDDSNDEKAALLQFNTEENDWDNIWNNYSQGGNIGYIGWHNISSSDKHLVGDFNNDGKDDLLSIQGFQMSNNFAQLHTFTNGTWINLYSNDVNEELGEIGSWNIHYLDIFKSGKFKAPASLTDYLLCFDGDGSNNRMLKFNSLTQSWDNTPYSSSSGSFGGWFADPLNSTDKLLIGDTDDLDDKEEILFVQRVFNAEWAVSFDLNFTGDEWNWNWNWEGSNNTGKHPYFDDWPINPEGGSNTDYLLIQAKTDEPEYLLAFRSFGTNDQFLVSMYRSIPNTQKSTLNEIHDKENTKPSSTAKIDENILLFPNPANSELNIHTANIKKIINISVMDLKGKVRNLPIQYLNDSEISMNLIDIESGVYFVKIVTQNYVITKKFIIN